MPAIDRILCPIDFSEPSLLAFDYAVDFAVGLGAELVLVHAFDNPASYDREGQWKPSDPSLVKKLDEIKPGQGNVAVTRVLHAGLAEDVICWAAQDQACDLIIMGTHGRTGLKHLLFGSTAEYVLKHATCPVLTIRQQPQDAPVLPEPMVTPIPAPRYM